MGFIKHQFERYHGARRRNSLLFFLGIVLLLSPLSTLAATLSLAPKEATHHVGENFTVSMLISADASINAFSGVLLFPTDTLQVISVSKLNSIVNLWTQDPSFSNAGSSGNVSFEGVVLNPGFIGPNGRILTITFRVKKEGSANLTFSQYTVLLNDGLGTNIVPTTEGAHLVFLPPSSVLPTTNPVAQEGGMLPSTHSTIIVREVAVPVGAVTAAWNFLPEWVKISVLGLVGLTALLLSLLIISFGVVTLIWLWGHLREREDDITRWLSVVQTLVKKFFMAIPLLLGTAKKEIGGDVKYSMDQLGETIEEAKDHVHHIPLSRVLVDFWASIGRIFKRFFTKNENTTKEIPHEKTQEFEERWPL